MERFVYNGRKSDGSYGLTDALTMSYVGNRLIRVVDAADPVVTNGSMDFKDGTDTGVEYTYNASGALTSDLNKGISGIDYDINGNMSKVTFSNGNTTEYVYSQSGAKQRVIHGTVTALPFAEPGISTAEAASVSRDTTEYIGDFVFRNGVLDRLLFRGGYMDIAGGVPRYHYFATDHLGSVRTVYGEDGVAEQLLTYDLFGGIIPELSTGMGMQPYGYNGKELDHTHGLDWYDYGARHYDSPIGRWTTMDPLCEKYYNVSPYVYCHNNPVNRIDYKGLYDFENICGYTDYPVIAVFQSNRDKTLEYDYQIAKEMGMPIFVVDNIGDFKDALDDLALKGSTFQTIALNSHGSYGKFNIGDDTIDMTTDLSSLREKLEGRTVFVGACNVGDSYGCFMVEGLAEQTSSTVVAACHKISAGYRYDGGDGLNYYEGEFPYIMLPSVLKGNKYILSESGSESKSVRNVTIDKRAGISWEGYYFDNYGIFNNKFRWAY